MLITMNWMLRGTRTSDTVENITKRVLVYIVTTSSTSWILQQRELMLFSFFFGQTYIFTDGEDEELKKKIGEFNIRKMCLL